MLDMGFERGLVVDCATGWSMSDEEQMEEVEQTHPRRGTSVVDWFSDVSGLSVP